METSMLKVTDLRPADYNPRKISDSELRKLMRSIESFGFVEPVVVNKDMTIIGGHQRVEAAKNLGMETVPCVVLNLSKPKEKALNLALNRISGDWDEERLKALLVTLDEEGRMLSGFDKDEIAESLEKALNPEDDDFDVQLPEKPVTQPGDVYKLGDHILMCGDSTNPKDVEALMGGVMAQMVFTDPPYNTAYEGGVNTESKKAKREMIKNDKMTGPQFREFLFKAFKNLVDHCEGAMYICMSGSEIPNLRSAFDEAGGHYQGLIIWAKNTFTLGRTDWQNQHEPILYGWPARVVNHYFVGFRDEGSVWDRVEALRPSYDNGKTIIKIGDVHLELDGEVTGRVIDKRGQTDIWKEKKPSKSPEHPTMKPVPLVTKALMASSIVGDTVLDLFGGSGTTLIACEETGRKCRIMELDPQYADVIVKRWEKLTGKKAERV